jgi:tryptophan halogenase
MSDAEGMIPFNRVVIVGGGTAGWMAAAALSKTFREKIGIELIESEAIGTVGVGEATIPNIKNFHLLLDLDEAEFMRAVHGTFKLGIEFVNWANLGDRYFHPFGPPGAESWAAQFHHYWLRGIERGEKAAYGEFSIETAMAKAGRFGMNGERKPRYAYHFDAGLYARLLRKFSENLGVRRIEGKVVGVETHPETGFIESVKLESGQVLAGDLFIDCTGFRGLLIEQQLKTGWEDWSHWLRNDRAVAVQTESVSSVAPYTRATARSAGWQWNIPLQHRVGNGLVYSSPYMPDDEATRTLLDNLDGKTINDPRVIKFRTGRRLKQWNRNCVALGLSSGFLEPLESTSIHLIQNGIIRLIKLFPFREIDQAAVDQYNEEVKTEIEFIRDFIILHYHLTQRGDSPYWDDCRNMQVPDTLLHKVSLFESSGLIAQHPYDLFADQSWAAVMLGQGVEPRGYHPVVEMAGDEELKQFLARIRASVGQIVGLQPPHRDFLAGYCSAPLPG